MNLNNKHMKETVITKLTIFSENRIVKTLIVGKNDCAKISHVPIDRMFYAYNDNGEKIFEAKNVDSYMIDCSEREMVYD